MHLFQGYNLTVNNVVCIVASRLGSLADSLECNDIDYTFGEGENNKVNVKGVEHSGKQTLLRHHRKECDIYIYNDQDRAYTSSINSCFIISALVYEKDIFC